MCALSLPSPVFMTVQGHWILGPSVITLVAAATAYLLWTMRRLEGPMRLDAIRDVHDS